jgi:aquaporin Z
MIQYISEFVGTFILIVVILISMGDKNPFGHVGPLAIGLALSVAIFTSGALSGNLSSGHYNPIVTMVTVINKTLSLDEALPFFMAQILAGVLALSYTERLQTVASTA